VCSRKIECCYNPRRGNFHYLSGPKSKAVAEAVRKDLPKVVNAFQPWLSSWDLDAGARWPEQVGRKLESAKAGIVCLTPGNLHEDWILFETGALAKVVEKTFVCPILIGLDPGQVKFPLAQFQSVSLTRDGIWRIITTFRKVLPPEQAMTDSQVEDVFELVWPGLERVFSNLPSEDKPTPPSRSPDEMTAEILEIVRGLSRSERVPTVAEWDSGMTGVLLKIANDLGLGVTSVSHTGIHSGVYSIGLQTPTGKEYRVRIPFNTPTSAFEAVVKAALSDQVALANQVALGSTGVRKEMVANESDFLNKQDR
jgi:hypothetical protein